MAIQLFHTTFWKFDFSIFLYCTINLTKYSLIEILVYFTLSYLNKNCLILGKHVLDRHYFVNSDRFLFSWPVLNNISEEQKCKYN